MIKFLPLCLILTLLTACGVAGELYLPEVETSESEQQNIKPNNN